MAAGLLAVCAMAVGHAASVPARGATPADSPVVSAPRGTPARAAADARAALGEIRLPAGSRRLRSLPRGVSAPSSSGFTRPFVTVKIADEYWTIPRDAVTALFAQTRRGDTSWSSGPAGGPVEQRGEQILLPDLGRWIGPRWLVIAAKPDPRAAGRWLVLVQSVVVWTPRRLVVPRGVRSVSVRRLQDSSVIDRVDDPSRVARIVAAVDALAVDNAIHAVYSCPALGVGARPGVELSFAGASGALLASASTEYCPRDLIFGVPGHGRQLLILGDLLTRLEAILGRRLPPAF